MTDTITNEQLEDWALALALARLVLEKDAEIERLRAALQEVFEIWAGSEGFIPETAPEGYLLMLVKKMADRAALAKKEESK